MTENKLPDGSYEYILDPIEDKETIEALVIIAKQRGVELNTPEFNDLFTELLTDMITNPEFIEKLKAENKGAENGEEKK